MTEHVRVGEVLALQRRGVIIEPDGIYHEVGIRSFGRGIFHKDPISGADLGAKRMFRIEPGDLVISNVFAWEGAIAVATEVEGGRVGSHRFMTFVPIDGRLDAQWAGWYLRSDRGLELIGQASPGSAGRNRTLAIDRFEGIEIPLPPIKEQRSQARYLHAASTWADTAARSIRQQSPDALVALLPGLADELIVPEEIGRSPLIDLADFVSDTVHPADDPAPASSFVGLQHIESHTGRRLGSDSLEAIKGRKFRFRPGDVLYGYLRPYLNKVWVADRHGLCSVDQYVLRPRSGVDAELLSYSLRGRCVLNRAIDLTHSLQLPRLRSGLLATLEIPVVPLNRAASLLEKLDRTRDRVVGAATRRGHQAKLVSALVPSALNEVFANLS